MGLGIFVVYMGKILGAGWGDAGENSIIGWGAA